MASDPILPREPGPIGQPAAPPSADGAGADARIPKILHYVWVGGSALPARFRRNVRSWTQHNPDFELKLWNDANIDRTQPFVQEAYRQRAWAKLSDYIRLLVVERHGGIYLDTDVEAYRSFDDLLACRCFFGYQSHREEDDPVCNAVFGAVPHHPFIRQVFAAFPTSTKQDLYEVGTGPELVSALLLEQGLPRRSSRRVRVADVDVFPPPAFYPYHWTEEFSRARITPETVMAHHWDMSWHHARSSAARQFLQRLLKTHPLVYRRIRRLYRGLR